MKVDSTSIIKPIVKIRLQRKLSIDEVQSIFAMHDFCNYFIFYVSISVSIIQMKKSEKSAHTRIPEEGTNYNPRERREEK